MPAANSDMMGSAEPNADERQGETIITVLWRFKWLLAIFLVVGTGIGYWMYKQKPTTYRATVQLLFKSDAPLTLDATTGAMRGGIPSGNLMQSMILSDQIIDRVAANLQSQSVPSLQSHDLDQIASLVRNGIQFQPITDQQDSRDRMVAALNFDGRDPQVCVAAVRAASTAISSHFEDERVSTITEFVGIVENAKGKFLEEQTTLEKQYQEFRQNVVLEFDSEGRAINPFRERQFQLQTHRIELEQRHRELSGELRFAESTRQQNDDPLMVAKIIGQLSGVAENFNGIVAAGDANKVTVSDPELQTYEVEKSLIPLKIKLEQLELTYGASHPEVKAIAMQIESSQVQLGELNDQISKRREELQSKFSKEDNGDLVKNAQIANAKNAVNAYVEGLQNRMSVISSDLKDLDLQIAAEKEKADNLKKSEDDNASYTRRIASIKGLGAQLEQKLAALNLADANGGISVEPLLDTGQAYVTGPDLKKDLIIYGMLGLGLSGLLAFAFEASAKMFRSVEEVQRELRSPVLSHIPLDEGRIKSTKAIIDPEIAELDPKLSVLHRPYSPSAEAVRGVRTAMLFDRRQFDSKVFQVTSPLPGDGKSTLAANVGCSIAQSGKRTLVIDLDLRSPRLSLRFNLESKYGLTNVLNGELGPAEAVHQTPIENLDVLPCGPLPANPAEALTLAELAEVFQWARENYDFVIVDTPPLLMVSDPAVVTTYVDAAMLVMRIRRRCKPNAKEAMAMLRAAGARVMGVVVNEIDEVSGGSSYKTSASGTYQSIGYGYGDKYRRRYQQEANVQDTYVVKGRHASVPIHPTATPPENGLGAEVPDQEHMQIAPKSGQMENRPRLHR